MGFFDRILNPGSRPELDEAAAKGVERLLARMLKQVVDRKVVIDRTGQEALTVYADITDREGRPLGVTMQVQFTPITSEKEAIAWAQKMGITGRAAKARGA